MNTSLHSINIGLETYGSIARALTDEHYGFMHYPDNPADYYQDNRFLQYYHISNAGKQLTEPYLREFVSTLEEIPITYPRIIGPIVYPQHAPHIYSRNVVEHSQGTTDLLLCYKCQKINRGYQSWTCSACKKYFHFECLPKHMRVFYADQQDPHWTIPISDIISGKYVPNPMAREELPNFYESDGHFKIQNEVLIHGGVYCPDCFERSCYVCRGMNASMLCQRCGARFHEECVAYEYDGKKCICAYCKIDGGLATVDKIIAIKFLSYEQLREIALSQLRTYMHEKYDANISLEENYRNYVGTDIVRTPCNVYLADRFYFLVKLNYQSYWRVKWISHQRIYVIARARLSAVNLLNCLTVYYGMYREFGLERVVQMNEINTKLGQQQSDEILKVDLGESSDTESSAPTNAETEFEAAQDNRFVSNCYFPAGFENYLHINQDDFILQSVPVKLQATIKAYLYISPQFVYDAVVSYAKVLHYNGVPPAFLVPNNIIYRDNLIFLVRWLGGNFEESTFESIYFLLPYGRLQLIQFFLESIGVKRCAIFYLVGLPLVKKTWILYDEDKFVKGRLGEYRRFVATPPYLLLGGKNLYDFYLTGINWLLFTHSIRRGVLFCDYMGLGKSIYVCGFIAALAEQGCFGTHLIVCPTSTLNNWVRELRKWVPFLSVGLMEVTDMVGIEITLKTGIKSYMRMMYENSNKPAVQDIGANIRYANSDNDAECRAARKKIMSAIFYLVNDKNNISNWDSNPDYVYQLVFTPLAARDYNGAQHYDVIILSYETATNLFRKRIDTIQYRDSQGKVYNKTYSSYFYALLESMGPFSTLICDEGHRLKGGLKNYVYSVLDHVKCKQRIILTGTPIQNNFEEFTNLLSFIEPNYFTEAKCNHLIYLATNASNPAFSASQRKEAINRLNETVRPHVLIRSHEDVFYDPVVKAEIFIPVDMTRRYKLIYSKILYDDRFNLTYKKLFKQRASMLRNTAVSLRHICNHPVLLDRRYQSIITKMDIEEFLDMSAKMKMVDRLLRGIHARGRKVLIFSYFVMVLNTLEILLKRRGYNFLRLDGSIHSADRQQLIDKFNDSANAYTVFILSTNSGGMGINLQTAYDVIIFDASWNPQNDLQAQYRAARIGQKEIVRVYKIFCRDTIDYRILERAKQKLSLSYILVKPLSGVSKIDDKDNMDDILNFGSQNLLKSFRDMNQEMVKIGEFFQNGIDFESDDFKSFMKAVEDKQIEYTDTEIDRLLDMEPVELAAEQTKCLHTDSADNYEANGATLNKNEFFAAFRVAEFRVAKNEEKDEVVSTYAREKKKPVTQPKATGIVADNTKYWTELFTNTFGEEVLKPQEKEEEQVELTEIDTDLSVFKTTVPKNAKQKDKYVFSELEVPVIKFQFVLESSVYEAYTGFIYNTVDQLIDVSSKASITYNMNEINVRYILHLAKQYLNDEQQMFEGLITIIKFAFASPVFACAAINHRELYKLQFDHKVELKITAHILQKLFDASEYYVLESLKENDAVSFGQLYCSNGFQDLMQDIMQNKQANRAYEFPNVFTFEWKSSYDQVVITVNEAAFNDETRARPVNISYFNKSRSTATFAGVYGLNLYNQSMLSLITPGKSNAYLVHLLHKTLAYYLKLYMMQADSHMRTIAAIDMAFNIIYFRRACTEVLRKFEMSGSDYDVVKQLTGVDVSRTAKRFSESNSGLALVEPRQLPITGTVFSFETIEHEINRFMIILHRYDVISRRIYIPMCFGTDLHKELMRWTVTPEFRQKANKILAFVILCAMFGFVTPHHVSLNQESQKYTHIINYNDELDAEYDLLYSNYAPPRPHICVEQPKFDDTHPIWRQIIGCVFNFSYIQVSLQASKLETYLQQDYDTAIEVLHTQQRFIVEQIESLKRKFNEKLLAKYYFVNYIKGSVMATFDEQTIRQFPQDICVYYRGYKEGFWHPADCFAFGVNYEARKALWTFFQSCGFPTDPEVFRLYKSKLGQHGAIARAIYQVGEDSFDYKFVYINAFFRDRILALFEAKLTQITNSDYTLAKCDPYYMLIVKSAPVCWKNLPFDFFIAQLYKERLFLLLLQCVIMDGCKDFLKTVLFMPDTQEKAVLEALVQLPNIYESDFEAFGLRTADGVDPLPMFTKNRVIANEKRRTLLYQQYYQYVAMYLPRVSTFLPSSVVQFVRDTAENSWLSLVCALLVLALFRYGFDGFSKYVLSDYSLNIYYVLINAQQTFRVRNDYFEKGGAFYIAEAHRLFASYQMPDVDKCVMAVAILGTFFMATQFAKNESAGADFDKRYWNCIMYEGSKEVWHAMQSYYNRNWNDDIRYSAEVEKALYPLIAWFADFKFNPIIMDCYPKEK